jgi:hypothetical protein
MMHRWPPNGSKCRRAECHAAASAVVSLQEKACLIASLAAGPSSASSGSSSSGSVKQALQENLVEQLQRHLDDLVAARTARHAVLRAA